MSRFSKSKFTQIVACLTLIAFTTSPCSCFAEEDIEPKSKSHSCCDESKKQENQSDDCDNCAGCTMSTSCYTETISSKTVDNFFKLNLNLSANTFINSISPILKTTLATTNFKTGPPDHSFPNSSTRSSLLQRWLI